MIAIPQAGWVTVLMSIVSSSVFTAIISHFLGRKRDREIEHLKSSLLEGAYVTRTQYDLELASYRELWEAASDIRQASNNLRIGESYSGDEFARITSEVKWTMFRNARTRFGQAFSVTGESLRRVEPFIAEEIRIAVYELLELADKIRPILLVDLDEGIEIDFQHRFLELYLPLSSAADELRVAISNRLAKMKIR